MDENAGDETAETAADESRHRDEATPDSDGNETSSEPTDVPSPASETPNEIDGFSGDVDLEDLDLDTDADDSGETDEASRGLFDDLLEGEPIFENKEVLRPSYTPA